MAKIEARFEREMEVRVPLRLEVTTRSGDISVHGGENGKKCHVFIKNGYFKTFPPEGELDGFFAARLRKAS